MDEFIKTEKRNNILVNAIYFVVLLCLIAIRVCSYYGVFAFLGKGASYYLSLFTQIGIIFLLPLILFKTLTHSKVRDVAEFCHCNKTSWKIVMASFGLGVLVFIFTVYASSFFNGLLGIVGYEHKGSSSSVSTWGQFFLAILCTALVPAICEETLHRGLLLTGNSMLGRGKSILLTGLMFGLLHLNIEQFFYAFLVGLLLGRLLYACHSIFPCMIVHFTNNALSVALSFASAKGVVLLPALEIAFSNFFFLFLFFFIVFFLIAIVVHYIIVVDTTSFFSKQAMNAYTGVFDDYADVVRKNRKIDDERIRELEEMMRIEATATDEEDEDNSPQEDYSPKMDKRSKIFFIGTIVLSAIITIMTFIWGLF